jgi:two-component system, OmpR family, sensor kinase
MCSSPPAETRQPARWRTPGAWSLRTRIVAIMMALLTVLGVAVGGTAEIFLHRSLYKQLDTRLADTLRRSEATFNRQGFPFPPPVGGRGPGPGGGPGGIQRNTIMLTFAEGDRDAAVGGIVTEPTQFIQQYTPLPNEVLAQLAALVPGDGAVDLDLGGYGDYRAIAELDRDGDTVVSALPLIEVQSILLRVALVTGSAVVIALVIAGWAGAFIVRITLRPLSRVASTAARVAELRLDRGAVQLAQRVPDRDTDPRTEVGRVGNALNRMLDHVGNALEARHASEMQVRQFVADASHELRTPLAAIRGYAELSRRHRAPIPDELAHVLHRVESEAERMTVLVEDLLLLARLDAGRPLADDPVDLTMLVVDAVSDAHAAGPRHDWQLDLPDEPVTVPGDQQRLHQVLANLLANARTHTPEGTRVTVRVEPAAGAAVLQVVDAGPGIPAELQPHIFERFARGDSSRSRQAGSTGLGLSIVDAVVTAHRGTVAVRSVPGRTAFTVRLPLGPPDPAISADGQLTQIPPRTP